MFFMFLVYSGIFRDYSNPSDVTKYYFEWLRNHEGFLTYQICKHEYFNPDKYGKIYTKYKMNLIDKIKLNLIDINNKNAHVQMRLFYKDKQVTDIVVELVKEDNLWLIQNVSP